MGASSEADFWHGENIDHAEKKSSKYCFWLFFSIFTKGISAKLNESEIFPQNVGVKLSNLNWTLSMGLNL